MSSSPVSPKGSPLRDSLLQDAVMSSLRDYKLSPKLKSCNSSGTQGSLKPMSFSREKKQVGFAATDVVTATRPSPQKAVSPRRMSSRPRGGALSRSKLFLPSARPEGGSPPQKTLDAPSPLNSPLNSLVLPYAAISSPLRTQQKPLSYSSFSPKRAASSPKRVISSPYLLQQPGSPLKTAKGLGGITPNSTQNGGLGASTFSTQNAGHNGQQQKAKKCKVLVVGDMGTGKSAIVHRFCDGNYPPPAPVSVGVDFQSASVNTQSETVRLTMWDTSGQDRFRFLVSSYLDDCRIALVVYDVTNKDSFMGVTRWVALLRQRADDKHNMVICLVGNKSDLDDSREVSFEEGHKKAEQLSEHTKSIILFTETSAQTGENVEQLFEDISNAFLEQQRVAAELEGQNATVEFLKTHVVQNVWGFKTSLSEKVFGISGAIRNYGQQSFNCGLNSLYKCKTPLFVSCQSSSFACRSSHFACHPSQNDEVEFTE